MNKKMTAKQTHDALKAKELLEKITADKMHLFLKDLYLLPYQYFDKLFDKGHTLSHIRLIISTMLTDEEVDSIDEVAKRHGLDFNYISVDKQKRRSTLYFVIKKTVQA